MELNFGGLETDMAQYFTSELVGPEVLTPDEQAFIARVSEHRVREYSAGRFCARMALARLDISPGGILTGEQKEPLWPQGIVGSISHARGFAGAVVAKKSSKISLGLDIEKIGRVRPPMWDKLFTSREQEYLNSLSETEKQIKTTLYFSMKESFYKLQHPVTQTYLWFTEVEIKEEKGTYSLKVIKEFPEKKLLPEYTPLLFARHEDLVVSVCQLE